MSRTTYYLGILLVSGVFTFLSKQGRGKRNHISMSFKDGQIYGTVVDKIELRACYSTEYICKRIIRKGTIVFICYSSHMDRH